MRVATAARSTRRPFGPPAAVELANEVIGGFADEFEAAYLAGARRKLGLEEAMVRAYVR